MSTSTPTHHRARLANRARRYPPDHPEVVDARRNLTAANAEQYIRRLVAAAPPLDDQTRDRLASLLAPSRVDGAA